jgi:hypothetical protein
VLNGKSDTVPAKQKVAKCMVVSDLVLPSAGAEHVDRIVECLPGITTEQLPRVIGRRELGSPETSGVPRGSLGDSKNPPKFRSFAKAEPNSQFHGICIHNNLISIRISLICRLSGTPD